MTNLNKNKANALRGGGTPYDGRYAEAPSERGTFLGSKTGIWNDTDFTSWSVWKGREFCHLGPEKDPKGIRDAFVAVKKSRKHSGLRFIHTLKKVHLQ